MIAYENFQDYSSRSKVVKRCIDLRTHACTHAHTHTHTHTHTHAHTHGWVSRVFVSTDARRALPSWCNRQHGGRVSQRYRFESRRGQWALFSLIPSALSFVFLWHTHIHTHTHARTHARMHTHTRTRVCMWLTVFLQSLLSVLIQVLKREDFVVPSLSRLLLISSDRMTVIDRWDGLFAAVVLMRFCITLSSVTCFACVSPCCFFSFWYAWMCTLICAHAKLGFGTLRQ